MSKQASADGTYVYVKGEAIRPEILKNFINSAKGLSDMDILEKVIFVDAGDSRIPEENIDMINQLVGNLKNTDMQLSIALWPDSVCCCLFYPQTNPGPKDSQLIRAYRNGHRARLAILSENPKR